MTENITPNSDGYCYLRFFKQDQQQQISERLGSWPDIEDVLAQGRAVWDDGVWLSLVLVDVHGGKAKAHVSERAERDMRMQFRGWQGKTDLQVFIEWCKAQTDLSITLGGMIELPDGGTLTDLFGISDVNATVGGSGDCWKKVTRYQGGDDTPVSLTTFAKLLIYGIVDVLGPGACEPPVFDTDICYICFEDDCDCEMPELTTPFHDALLDYKIKLTVVEGGLHLEGYRWKSASRANSADHISLALLLNALYKSSATVPTFDMALNQADCLANALVGLTSVFVLGTIGDVQPAVEAASSAYVEAEMQRESKCFSVEECKDVDAQLISPEGGIPLETLALWDIQLATSLVRFFDSPTPYLGLMGGFLNSFLPCPWRVDGSTILAGDVAVPSRFNPGQMYFLSRWKGELPLALPDDLVVVTHPEHEPFVKLKYPGAQFRAVPVPFHDFIKLGQDLMCFSGMFGLGHGLPKLFEWMMGAFEVFRQTTEESDLVFAVSGAVVGGILSSLYPSHNVYEVCPVPRSDSKLCPEFYLSGLLEGLPAPPRFTKDLAKALDTWLAQNLRNATGLPARAKSAPRIQAAPGYALRSYGVGGAQTPNKLTAKFAFRSQEIEANLCNVCKGDHVLPPWPGGVWADGHHDGAPQGFSTPPEAFRLPHQHAWYMPTHSFSIPAIGGLGVVFRPTDMCPCGAASGEHCACSWFEDQSLDVLESGGVDVRRVLSRAPRVYVSMGSCEQLNDSTKKFFSALRLMPFDFTIDARWQHLLPEAESHGYVEHATFLSKFDVVVHHGGAGVVFTCLELGVWQIVLPQVGDQFEWRRFVLKVGAMADYDPTVWINLSGTSPGRFPRRRVRPNPIQSEGRFYKLHHYMDVELPAMAARELYEKACNAVTRQGDLYCEAYWMATGKPPLCYKFTHPSTTLDKVWQTIVEKYGVDGDDVLERLGKAIFNEIGFASVWSILKQVPMKILLLGGLSSYAAYLRVLGDAMRHYMTFAERMGVKHGAVAPDPLPVAEYTSLVPTVFGLPVGIHTTQGFDSLRGTLNPADLHIYLRCIKVPALGLNFGLFHAVVWLNGHYYELQRVKGGKNLLVKWTTPPFVNWDSPIVRVITVPIIKNSFSFRNMAGVIDGGQYRAAGDNCLFFANLMVHSVTQGRVVPWELFGFYGTDLPNTVSGVASKWLEGCLTIGPHDVPWQGRGLERNIPNLTTAIDFWQGQLPGCASRGSGSVAVSYGRQDYEKTMNFLHCPDVAAVKGKLTGAEHLPSLLTLATTRFGLSAAIIHRSLEWSAVKQLKLPGDELALLMGIGARLQLLGKTPLAGQVSSSILATKRWWGLKGRKKVVWAPLLEFSTPHHWMYVPEGGHFKSTFRASDQLQLSSMYNSVKLDLRQILAEYEKVFPEVVFPDVRVVQEKAGVWRLETQVPLREFTAEYGEVEKRLIQSLLAASGNEMGVFSLRYATPDMAEQVTDRYFTGVPEGFLSEERKEQIAQAIVDANPTRYLDTKLAAPEDVFKKWHTSYSAGFPYRFNSKGKAKRADLIAAAGGKKAFLAAVRRYIAEPSKFPTVSHAFVKEEVLPEHNVGKGKIRTIMAQDLLSYFTQMAVEGDLNKRMDPQSFCAVGVSAQHGDLGRLAHSHRRFKHHYASDITALDSRLSWDYLDICTRVRKKGFINHPQRNSIDQLLDVSAENLYTSWVIDIHTGQSRLKRQGASTGHASTTPTNSLYVEAMFLDAWLETTPFSLEQFYEDVKVSTYSDDNFYSTNLPREVFGPEVLQNYLARRGVHLKLEAEGDEIDAIPFLAKHFSTQEEDYKHVEAIIGHRPEVCVHHNRGRLVMKFSDIKGRMTLNTRWDRAASFLENCAHHPDLHQMVWEYMQVDLVPRMQKRKHLRKWMEKRTPRTYEEVLRLQYLSKGEVPFIPTPQDQLWDTFVAKMDELRTEIIAWDGSLNTFSRMLERWAGFLHIIGLEGEKTGYDVSDPTKAHLDLEFVLERHLYIHAGCPEDLATLRKMRSMSPYGQFMRLEEFFSRKSQWVYREQDKSSLNAQVALLMGIYAIVAALEQQLFKVPVVGPLYKAFTRMKMISSEAYANLNALNYTLFGKSSEALGALMPKDSHEHLKFLAIRIWSKFTHLDGNFQEVNWSDMESMMREWFATLGMLHGLVFESQYWCTMPIKEGVSRPSPIPPGMDHSNQVARVLQVLNEGGIPMVTGRTGAGKSTAFVQQLHQHFETTYLSMPRRALVDTNIVATARVHSASDDRLTRGAINAVTHGYLRLALTQMHPREILIIDEFHELDEDSLILLQRFRGKVVLVSATPPKVGYETVHVPLVAAANSEFTVLKEELQMPGVIEDKVLQLIHARGKGRKIMVIHPSKRVCSIMHKAFLSQLPGRKSCVVWKGDTSLPESDVYFCTSVVDAGITIPDVDMVIDTGLSVGRKAGKFGTFASSRQTAEQRAGRTGRTVSGEYIRLSKVYDDVKFDFSTTFGCNNNDLARLFGEKRSFPKMEGMVPFLPGLYNKFVIDRDFSACVFWYCMVNNESQCDAKLQYLAMRHNPRSASWCHIFELYGFPELHEWDTTTSRMMRFEVEGKNWVSPTSGKLEFVPIQCEARPNYGKSKQPKRFKVNWATTHGIPAAA